MNNNQNFLDSKTLMAVFLVGACWLGWQYYMRQKYPDAFKPPTAATTQTPETKEFTPDTQSNIGAQGATEKTPEIAKADKVPAVEPEKLYTFDSENLSFQMSSYGMGLTELKLKKYTDRENKSIVFSGVSGDRPFETNLVGRTVPLIFTVEKSGENVFIGRARVGTLEVIKQVTVQPSRYLFDTEITVKNLGESFGGVTVTLAEEIKKFKKATFFLPQFEHQELFFMSGGSKERSIVHAEESLNATHSNVSIVAIGSQYFAQAIADRSSVIPEGRAEVIPSSQVVRNVLTYAAANRSGEFKLNYLGFMGPKSYDLLTSIDSDMGYVINYGMFSWIAHYILKLMIWFHSVIGNWGVAIILLTVLVRILVLPFTLMSFKSMKAMQKLQPEMKALREKYKDEPQKQQAELMTLMRTHKVNPLGGCLPMLLQFPIFLALYQVLGQSIELYKAPFALWIHDLSLKDPFYVLPVLMGVTLFFQQKISPNPSMDPTQAKILMFMPVIFSFFMLSLPSGLTLYIFVSGLFGIGQQLYFMRDTTVATPVNAKAE